MTHQHRHTADQVFSTWMGCLDQAAEREATYRASLARALAAMERADRRITDLVGLLQESRKVCFALSWALRRRQFKDDRSAHMPSDGRDRVVEQWALGDAIALDGRVVKALTECAECGAREVDHAA